jgi:phospholipid/cholesterol/gamma-HCH transport system ATP-binding protein
LPTLKNDTNLSLSPHSGLLQDVPSLDTISHEPLIRIEQLSVEFGRHEVLRDIDLAVARGQTLAIIGESGCGKTVLLKTILGLLRPTRGSVMFDGQDLARLGERALARQRIRFGFVFQQAALFDSMTIAQNVAFPLRQHTRKSAAAIEEIVMARLTEVGLPGNVRFKKPAELSGGMRKRVGLARALALEPEVVLYDEPTTGLDPIMSDVINELMLATRRRHPVTSVLVTHDMKSAWKVADRIVMMYPLPRLKEGEPQILFDGTPAELEQSRDHRVTQFVQGEAGERLMEMQAPSPPGGDHFEAAEGEAKPKHNST